MMGLATLAKGPVGLILPIIAVLPALLIERDVTTARRLFSPVGIALYLLVTLSWFGVFAWRLGAGYALWVLMHQNIERYVGAWNSTHPVWYYLWRFPVGFFPWIVFLPWGVAQAFSARERERRRSALFLVTWIGAILLFFSFSTGKRGVYIIPLYPAAAILVARLLTRASAIAPQAAGQDAPTGGDVDARRRLRRALRLWVAAGVALAAALPLAAGRHYPDLVPLAAVLGALFAAGAIAAAVLEKRGRSTTGVAVLIGSLVLIVLVSTETLLPWANRRGNIRGFAEQVRARLPPGGTFATTEQKRDDWVFYTGHFAEQADTPRAVVDYLSREGPRDLLLEDEILNQTDVATIPGVVELLRGTVAGQGYHLLRKEAPR